MSNEDSDADIDAQTRLLLTGVRPSDVDEEFLTAIHELADERGLSLRGISVGEP